MIKRKFSKSFLNLTEYYYENPYNSPSQRCGGNLIFVLEQKAELFTDPMQSQFCILVETSNLE